MQRVAIASVLAMEPEILLLDEPTSQLDPQGSEEVFHTVELLAKTGITIFMIEQKMEKLASYCDRILLLHEGKQIAFDTPEKIFSRSDLQILVSVLHMRRVTAKNRTFCVRMAHIR